MALWKEGKLDGIESARWHCTTSLIFQMNTSSMILDKKISSNEVALNMLGGIVQQVLYFKRTLALQFWISFFPKSFSSSSMAYTKMGEF